MSRYGQKEKYSFTLEDVHQWLDGNVEAGNRIWFDSGFYDSMLKHIKYEGKQNFRDSSNIFMNEHIELISCEILEKMILNVRDKFKPEKFKYIGAFINYFKNYAKKRFNGYLKYGIITETQNFNRIDDEQSHNQLNSISLQQCDQLNDENMRLNKIYILDLLNQFENSEVLQKNQKLYNRFLDLKQIVGGEYLLLYVFLNDKDNNYKTFMLNGAKELNIYDESTWRFKNRDLRTKFKKFIQSKQEYKNIFEE